MSTTRTIAYGQLEQPRFLDRLGVWLGDRAVHRHADFAGRRFADLGCGFNAKFARGQLDAAASVTLVDLALADDLKTNPKVTAIEGYLPDALSDLGDASFDVILLLSVIEHLTRPQDTLDRVYRLLAPGGVAIFNVPSWLGKPFLEFNSFKLKATATSLEIDDHKRYYDPRDLWPMLVQAGFRPSSISCHRHKLGLNTAAVCRIPN